MPTTVFRRRFSAPALAAAILAGGMAHDAATAGETALRSDFDVDVKGVTVMKLDFSATISEAAYRGVLKAKTTGMAEWFSEYKMTMETSGAIAKNSFFPTSFERERKKNGKRKTVSVPWSGGRPQITEDNSGDNAGPMAEAVTKGTLDPISILLRVAFSPNASPCKGQFRVFDGRDVYDVTMRATEAEDGAASACKLTASYLAGNEVEDAKPEAPKPDNYTIHLRSVDAPALGRALWVPEKITGRASGQSFVASAQSIDVTSN